MNVVFSSAISHIKQSISRSMFKFCIFINPIMSGFLLGMIYRNKSKEEFILYAFLGAGMGAFWSSICYSSASDIEREKWMGTLPIIFVSPAGFKKIILGKILGNTFLGIVTLILNISTVYFLFKISIKFYSLLYFVIVLFLTLLSMVSIAFLICALFTLSRKIRLMMNFIEFPVITLTGLFFPIEILPISIRKISYLISITWGMKGFRVAIYGGNLEQMMSIIFIILFLIIIYSVLGIFLFKKIEKLCIINATLEVF